MFAKCLAKYLAQCLQQVMNYQNKNDTNVKKTKPTFKFFEKPIIIG